MLLDVIRETRVGNLTGSDGPGREDRGEVIDPCYFYFLSRDKLTIEDECGFDTDRQPGVYRSLYQQRQPIVFAPEHPREPGLMEECIDKSVVRHVLFLHSLALRNSKSDLTTNRRRPVALQPHP